MTRTVQGVIHGRSIELDADPGIGDGQRVEVVIIPAAPTRPWGEGILRSAGVAADVPGFDEAFEQIQHERELSVLRDLDDVSDDGRAMGLRRSLHAVV